MFGPDRRTVKFHHLRVNTPKLCIDYCQTDFPHSECKWIPVNFPRLFQLVLCHNLELNEMTPLDKSHSAPGTELGHNGRLVSLHLAWTFLSLRTSNPQMCRQVLPMPLFSPAFTGIAGRFSCHHTMPKQEGISNSIKSTRLCQVGPGPVWQG